MSMIKMNSNIVKSACIKGHLHHNEKTITNFDGTPWIDKDHKEKEHFSLKTLLQMSKTVEDSSYPYVLLSKEDFLSIKRYL